MPRKSARKNSVQRFVADLFREVRRQQSVFIGVFLGLALLFLLVAAQTTRQFVSTAELRAEKAASGQLELAANTLQADDFMPKARTAAGLPADADGATGLVTVVAAEQGVLTLRYAADTPEQAFQVLDAATLLLRRELEHAPAAAGGSYKVTRPPTFPLEAAGLQFRDVMMIGPLLAILLPLLALCWRMRTDQRIRSADELDFLREHTLLASIPPLKNASAGEHKALLGALALVLLAYTSLAFMRFAAV